MKYLFFTLFLALAMSSCTTDEIAKPVDTHQKVDARELIANSQAFAKFLQAKPNKGWDDESFTLALEDFDADYMPEVEAVLGQLPDNSTVEFNPKNIQPLLFTTLEKVGPCSEAHIIEIEHAAVEAGICMIGSEDIGDVASCIASYANERVKADRQYEHCLTTTYPNANTGG